MDRDAILPRLDRERKRMGTTAASGFVRVEMSDDATCCAVVSSACTEDSIDAVIRELKTDAHAGGYAIDWKVYGHDQPSDLRERLIAARFEPEPREQVLALPLSDEAVARFPASRATVQRIAGLKGLDDVADISREIGRTGVEQEKERFVKLLQSQPTHMSIFVAYDEDAAASCGRIYYYDAGGFAELCGGRTKTAFRNRGLYLGIVRARLVEAMERGFSCVTVDALPTSEPLLRSRGFEPVTWTEPLVYRPQPAA